MPHQSPSAMDVDDVHRVIWSLTKWEANPNNDGVHPFVFAPRVNDVVEAIDLTNVDTPVKKKPIKGKGKGKERNPDPTDIRIQSRGVDASTVRLGMIHLA